MEKLQPKAIIFDLGSTLIEYEAVPWPELAVECINKVGTFLKKKGYDVPDKGEFYSLFDEVKGMYRETAAKKLIEWSIPQAAATVLKKLNIDNENGLADKMFEEYYKPVDEKLYVYDDTKAMLELIKEKIGRIGLISNTIFPEQTHLKELKRFKIEKYFDFTIFSSTVGVRKPHPDIFIKAANMAGLAPGECVYVGDRYIEDVTGPNGIGMPAILKKLEIREYPEDMPETVRTITCLTELHDHIELN